MFGAKIVREARGMSVSTESGMTAARTIAGFSLKQFVQPPYQRLPWHAHGEASFCFVVSGSYTERFGSVNRECLPHVMVFKPAVERHADQFGRLGATCLLVEIPAGRLGTLDSASRITTRPMLLRSAKLASLGHDLYRELRHEDRLSPLAVEGLVLEILAEAARRERAPDLGQRPPWLRRAHDIVRDRFSEPVTLSSVAREVGVHASHLARMFRIHYRCSIGEYVRRLRIERASRELAETDRSIAEIGLRAGFFDQSHFARVFKELTRRTPARFRALTENRSPVTRARDPLPLRGYPDSPEHEG
jgi:AraC family transcriptional regulator